MAIEKYNSSFGMLSTIIIGFNIFLFGIMGFYWIDSLFFNDALLNGLRTGNQKVMVGAILIPIFGGGALLMYFGTESNEDWSEAYIEKMEAQFEQADNAPEQTTYDDVTETKAAQFAADDENFGTLYNRFKSYLANVSGEGIPGLRMAVDIGSGSRMNMMSGMLFMGFLVVPVIIVVVVLMYYVEENYGVSIGEAVSSMRHISPINFYVSFIMFVGGIIYAFKLIVLNAVKRMLGFVTETTESVMNTAPPDSFDNMYQSFLREKIQQMDTQWSAMIWKGLIALMFLPFIVGFALVDLKILMVSLPIAAIALFMLKRGAIKDTYQVSEKGWIRYVTASNVTTDFNLNDCDEVIVRYQSIRMKGTRVSSDSAMMRDVLSRSLTEAMDVPELIPSTIIFYRKNDTPVLLPLRFMNDEEKDAVDSHQIEFFFALWLKERGFAFELQETDEDAGDWRAFRV